MAAGGSATKVEPTAGHDLLAPLVWLADIEDPFAELGREQLLPAGGAVNAGCAARQPSPGS